MNNEIKRFIKKLVEGIGRRQLRYEAEVDFVFPGWIDSQQLMGFGFRSDRGRHIIA